MNVIHEKIPIREVFEWAEDIESSAFLDEWKRMVENGEADPDELVLVFDLKEDHIPPPYDTTDGEDFTEEIEALLARGVRVYMITDDHNIFRMGYVVEKP